MKRDALINDTFEKIKKLPDTKIKQVNDFAEFLLSKIDDKVIQEGMQKLSSDSKAFEYLKNEETIYSVNDLKEKYK